MVRPHPSPNIQADENRATYQRLDSNVCPFRQHVEFEVPRGLQLCPNRKLEKPVRIPEIGQGQGLGDMVKTDSLEELAQGRGPRLEPCAPCVYGIEADRAPCCYITEARRKLSNKTAAAAEGKAGFWQSHPVSMCPGIGRDLNEG